MPPQVRQAELLYNEFLVKHKAGLSKCETIMSQLKTATKEMASHIQELKANAREITQWGSDLRKALAGTIGVESDQLRATWDKMSVADRAGFGGSFEKYSTAVGKYLSTQKAVEVTQRVDSADRDITDKISTFRHYDKENVSALLAKTLSHEVFFVSGRFNFTRPRPGQGRRVVPGPTIIPPPSVLLESQRETDVQGGDSEDEAI
jgi:hypothetical protein